MGPPQSQAMSSLPSHSLGCPHRSAMCYNLHSDEKATRFVPLGLLKWIIPSSWNVLTSLLCPLKPKLCVLSSLCWAESAVSESLDHPLLSKLLHTFWVTPAPPWLAFLGLPELVEISVEALTVNYLKSLTCLALLLSDFWDRLKVPLWDLGSGSLTGCRGMGDAPKSVEGSTRCGATLHSGSQQRRERSQVQCIPTPVTLPWVAQ